MHYKRLTVKKAYFKAKKCNFLLLFLKKEIKWHPMKSQHSISNILLSGSPTIIASTTVSCFLKNNKVIGDK